MIRVLRSWQRMAAAVGLLVAGLLFARLAHAQGIVPDSTELRVLRQFYHHTGGPQWHQQGNWSGQLAPSLSAVAGWTGLQVINGDITDLALPGNNLNGHIPDCLGELKALRRLQLGGNPRLGEQPGQGDNPSLAGSWPGPAIRGLVNLEVLQLYECGLRGPLGNDFGAMPKLYHVYLASNALDGAVPVSLVNAPALRNLYLHRNQLSGSVPGNWANRHGLQELALHGNALSGPLPVALGRLSHLRYLSLASNHLQGFLPDSLARCAQLQTLDLSQNEFTGPLPVGWNALQQLSSFYASHNQLEGGLPAAWSTLPLVYLFLDYNRLSGSVPPAWGSMSVLQQLLLGHNQLSGALPQELGQLQALTLLDAPYNRLSGGVPGVLANLPRLARLDLSHNQLSGTLPEGLHAAFLLLEHNRLSGRLPNSYAAAAQQGVLQLLVSDNELTGIPAMGPWGQVQLGLSGNYLQFDSYEANVMVPGQYQFFDYGQRIPSPADTQYVVAGARAWLRRSFAGAHNRYHWQRQMGQFWIDISPAEEADSLLLPRASEALEGAYRIRVTNDWLPWITMYTKSIYVSVLPYSIPPRNEPAAAAEPSLVNAAPPNRSGATDVVNYVRTFSARAGYSDASALRQAPVSDVQVKTDYLDGLGRPLQTVVHRDSPGRRDVVQVQAYDEFNRQPKQYLPYTALPSGSTTGAYRPNSLREQYDFYRTPSAAGIPASGVAFAETLFDASPLSRPVVQAAPGETWRLQALDNHTVHLDERPNNAEQDTVRCWRPGYGSERENLDTAGVYAPNKLWVKQTTDEQGQVAREYTDLEGRVVLKQVSTGRLGFYTVVRGTDTARYERRNWLSTYYVYDDFGRLRAVVPPLAEQRLRQHQWVVDGGGVERLLFRYHYDDQGRLTEKQVPDQDGYTYTIYDDLDRPILVQDPAQRAQHQWLTTKYDTLGRMVCTALITDRGLSRAQWQTAAAAATVLCEQTATTPGPGGAYYTNRAFPILGAADQVLSTTDYDSYDFDHDGSPDARYQARYDALLDDAAYQAVPDLRTVGQPTRSRVRVLGTPATAPGAWVTTSEFVDEKLRTLQTQTTNARGYRDVATARYDFAGKVLASYTVHHGPQGSGEDSVAVLETSTYDHAGRLLATQQTTENGSKVTLAAHRYNELGQLMQKRLGDSTARKALQTVDYSYNIRGWLTQVNDAQLTPQAGQRPDLFGLELSYDYGFNTNQYNGNIAGQKWRTASDNVERAYGYRYDQLSRILQGDFVARDAAGAWNAERDNYRFWAASYDANGNLLTARRRGLVQEATRTTPRRYGETDNLRYRYQPSTNSPTAASNRLLRVDDLAPVAAVFGPQQPTRPDFQDGSTSGSAQPDYEYDQAGSLTRDRNKDIDTIRYNYLHLPTRIVWANGNRLEFRYTAAGQKVAKLATAVGKPTVRTDYLGAWQYESDSLRWLNTSEGRALRFVQRNAAGQPTTRYSYEYTIKDHLGNLRVAFRPGDRVRHRATMEPGLADQEEAQFDYVRETRFQTADAAAGQYAARLNAALGKPIGPLKTLTVRKGDTLQIEAFGRYNQPIQNFNYGFSLLSFVTSLLQPAGTPAPGDGQTVRQRALPFLGIGLTVAPQLIQLTGGVPKAYLRVLVFNRDSALLTSYTQQLTMAANGNYQRLGINLTAPQDGFVQAFVGNESDTDVYFDDISVDYQPALLVQENQYDPFGLDLAGLNKNTIVNNNYLYNGKECQREFELNWADYGARFYDNQILRWISIDPLLEKMRRYAPYAYAFDNPVRFVDPDGMAPGDPLKKMEVRENRASNLHGNVRRGGAQAHQGFDLKAKPYTPVHSVGKGKIDKVDNAGKGAYGKSIQVEMIDARGKRTYAFYAHLAQIDVKMGVEVTDGQVIGATGRTGNASGNDIQPHLHFEYRSSPVGGKGLSGRLDPNTVLSTKFYSQDPSADQRFTGVLKVDNNGITTKMNIDGSSSNLTVPALLRPNSNELPSTTAESIPYFK